uniref:AlNc14C21G2198 protein n=1 Tax=Albugo laibachii Nc14 TaxID=890382 RepID=F0W5N3_9STRA|nr:AlNc14C21G2198 [Albugo laibachii Nc14]|eukprot:CCA16424.1 AlNc14C21G2198 [Albugo laibachii Nc14]
MTCPNGGIAWDSNKCSTELTKQRGDETLHSHLKKIMGIIIGNGPIRQMLKLSLSNCLHPSINSSLLTKAMQQTICTDFMSLCILVYLAVYIQFLTTSTAESSPYTTNI